MAEMLGLNRPLPQAQQHQARVEGGQGLDAQGEVAGRHQQTADEHGAAEAQEPVAIMPPRKGVK